MLQKNCISSRLLLVLIISMTACDDSSKKNITVKSRLYSSNSSGTTIDWQAVSKKKIFFGHQSVGNNIVDGIKEVSKAAPEGINIHILDARDAKSDRQSYIAHSIIGKNEDPLSKIKDFTRIIDGGMGEDVDIAFMKFCYVDFRTDSKMKVEDVFNNYKDELLILKEKYPNTKFIHVTAPLRTVQSGVKAKIKKIIGKTVGGYENNILRNKFNNMLIDEFSGTDPIFDLARIEATKPDGSLEQFFSDGNSYFALSPEYAEDRGHLNDLGKKIVAEALLRALAESN